MRPLPLRVDTNFNGTPPLINDRWHYPITSLTCSSIDVKATAEGRYQAYFGSAKTSASYNLFEFASTHPVVTLDGSAHYAFGRWLLTTLASSATNVGFGAAVAAATVQGSGKIETNTFRAHLRGFPDAKFSTLRDFTGSLDAHRMKALGEALSGPLAWCIDNADNKIKPRDDKEEEARAPGAIYTFEEDMAKGSAYDLVGSALFALQQIHKGRTLEGAEKALDSALTVARSRVEHKRIDPLAVAAMYHRFHLANGATPSHDDIALASNVLKRKAALPDPNDAQQRYRFEVSPFVSADGVVLDLLRLGSPAARIKVQPWPPKKLETNAPNAHMGSFDLLAQTAFRVGAATMATVDAKADIRFHGYGFTSEYMTKGLPNGIILNEYYAAGVEVHTACSGADLDLSVEAVAAKATTSAVNANYSVSFRGIDLSAIPAIAPFTATSFGKLDVSTLNGLGLMYAQASAQLSEPHGPGWTPVLSAVDVDLGAEELQALCNVDVGKLGG